MLKEECLSREIDINFPMSVEKDKGFIVILNGATSSGKSSVAKSLQENLNEPFLHVEFDKFKVFYNQSLPKRIRPPAFSKDLSPDEIYVLRDKDVSHNMRYSIFFNYIALLADNGFNILLDIVLATEQLTNQCIRSLKNTKVLFIGLFCSLEELERREKERSDRREGLVKIQYNRVHEFAIYDLKIDTFKDSIIENTLKIKEAINSHKIVS
ncbi:MAG: hypothetical protein HeimAB125_14090 [Candidatus Heimdallarchaeota archaeon AB_125]|nr:MAG: hypothetical protein HeimAB125_14090 [Candidatus Heimdallarchaeota archaeon AB_125]